MHVQPMKFVRYRLALLSLVVPSRVLAFPVPYTSAARARTCTPLIVVSVSLFVLSVVFLGTKFVYMKHRRIGTIHGAPSGPGDNLSASPSRFGSRHEQGKLHRGLLVGCLGSPTWETTLTAKLDKAARRRRQWRKSSLGYQRHGSSTHSTCTRPRSQNYSSSSRPTKCTSLSSCPGNADQPILPLLSDSSYGGRASKALYSIRRDTLRDCHHLRYGDFGESRSMRLPGGSAPNEARRASPSSVRLVNGPSHSNQVEYSFLSVLPPGAAVISPLMGTRDSFQLSRCSVKCNRKPVPPMPPLPLFLPFHLPQEHETMESHAVRASEYLPPLRLSPFASVIRVFQPHQLVEKLSSIRVADRSRSESNVYSRVPSPGPTSFVLPKTQGIGHAGPQASASTARETPTLRLVHEGCKGLAIGGIPPQTNEVSDEDPATLLLDDKRRSEIESGTSRNDVVSKKPLKSCLRQNPAMTPTLVCSPDAPSTSEASTRAFSWGTRWSMGNSLRTPMSEVDIGVLGLDRFHWSDEVKELKTRSSHAKQDSVALVPY